MTKSIAIIGTGISALQCARSILQKQPKSTPISQIILFDKAKGPSGRVSTRRTTFDHPRIPDKQVTLYFDHGAQYFTSKSTTFEQFINNATQSNNKDFFIEKWQAKIGALDINTMQFQDKSNHTRYVACPTNNALGKLLYHEVKKEGENLSSQGMKVDFAFEKRVSQLSRVSSNGKWQLVDSDGVKYPLLFDSVVITAPLQQAKDLLDSVVCDSEEDSKSLLSERDGLVKKISEGKMDPCWCLMVAFDRNSYESELDKVEFDGMFVNKNENGGITWISKESSKPHRKENNGNGFDCFVVHTSPEWSKQHLEKDSKEIEQELLNEFYSILKKIMKDDVPLDKIKVYSSAHRWRFSMANPPLYKLDEKDSKKGFLWNEKLGLMIAGDYVYNGNIEGAYLSGTNTANELLNFYSKL